MSDLSPNITQPARRKAKLSGATPLKNDPVARGREAWERRKGDVAASWNDWKLIGKALLYGRQTVMKKVKADKPAGKRYNVEFGYWVDANGFGDIDGSDRAKLLSIMENLPAIEKWRAKLEEGEGVQRTHPSNIWRAWTCKDRGNRGKSQASKNGTCSSEVDDEEEQEEDEHQTAIKWQRNILLRAQKSIGDAKLRGDRWVLPEPPEDGTIDAVRLAAQAWADLAKFLEAQKEAA